MSVNLFEKTILVVEDDERCWYLLRDVIEFANGRTIWADSGLKAIEILKSNQAIALVLMDMQLPFMNGINTTKKIKEIYPRLPIIAQTAFSDPAFLQDCISAGCINYVLKPIDIGELEKKIEKILH